MFLWSVNGSETVLGNTRPGENASPRLHLASGQNMTVTGRVLLRAWEDFTVESVAVTAPAGVDAAVFFAVGETFDDGITYPDRLIPAKSIAVKAHCTQNVWVILTIRADAAPGEKPIKITVTTEKETLTADWLLTVYPVLLPEPKDSSIGHEYFIRPNACETEDGAAVNLYDDQAEAIAAFYAKTMKALRINSLRLPIIELLSLAGSSQKDGVWQFDYSLVDQLITRFLENGSFNRITAAHFCQAVTGESVFAPDGTGKTVKIPARTPEAEAWLRVFLTSLTAHFEEKGWLNLLWLHLEDEPHTSETWLWARQIVRECAPNVKCAEPLDTHEVSLELPGACDCYIPRFEIYASDRAFYQERKKRGDELWCYCCCYPEDAWWLNHFIDQPLVFGRLIGWACFSQHMDGFLHWGFNFWGKGLYGRTPEARFKGDGYIVYPGNRETPLTPSARFFASLDGLQDWELLKMLEVRDPAAALALAKVIAADFSHFTADTEKIGSARETLLESLSVKG